MKGFVSIFCCFFVFSLMISCKKEYPCEGCADNKNKPPHAIKARIIEYGTGLPLADAIVDVVAVHSATLPGSMIFKPTDINGECSFLGNGVAFREFSKTGYWNTTVYPGFGVAYQFSPILLFPTTLPF